MPSSRSRRRIEVPTHFYDRLAQIAKKEDRTIANVVQELLFFGLQNYQPSWVPAEHLHLFDEGARDALTLAREEAQSFNHNYIGTEHVLLGLLRQGEGLAARALTGLGLEFTQVRQDVETIIGRGDRPTPSEIEYVPRVRRVLRLAVGEARALGQDSVSVEHLLLGLVQEGEGIAAGIMESHGVLRKARERVLALMEHGGADAQRRTATT